MKKIIFMILTSLTLICLIIPSQSKNINSTNQNENYKNNIDNSVNKIAVASISQETISWKEAKDNQLSLNGYTMVFNISYVSHVTLDSSYCSIYFYTTSTSSLVIDIEASNYPTYTFTNRYEGNTFASVASYNGGTVEYVLPDEVTTVEQASFTKTSMASSYTSDDDILNDFIYFIAPIVYPSATFSYKVLPEEANNKDVTINLSWSDNSIEDNIDNYLSYEHDNINYKITITCFKKANYQGELTITSVDNPSISSSVTIDFEQEFLGFKKNVYLLYSTLSLENNEKIINEEEVKQEILNNSQGFLGTIAIESKEITNFTMTFSSAKITLANPDNSSFVQNNTTYNDVYKNARSKESSKDFISEIGTKYITLLSDSLKQKIKDCETVTFQGNYNVTFDYYGSSYEVTAVFYDTISSTLLSDYTYIEVSSIETENNITFQ